MSGRGSSQRWQWLGFALVGGLLVLMVRGMDWAEVGSAFRQVDLKWFPVLLVLLVVVFLLRAWRWKWLLAEKKVPFRILLEATVAGFGATFILPFRLGELVRPWTLDRWGGVKFGTGVASIVVERIMDGLVIVATLGLTSRYWMDPPEWLGVGARAVGWVAVVGILGVVLAYRFAGAFTKFGQRMVSMMFRGTLEEKLHELVDEFFQGLRSIRTFQQLVVVILSSVLMWASMGVFYQVGLLTMGISLPMWAGMTVMVLVALAVGAPGPPGFLGTFQIGCLAALGLYGVEKEQALSYSLVMHLLQAVLVIGVGLWVMKRRGMKVSEAARGKVED